MFKRLKNIFYKPVFLFIVEDFCFWIIGSSIIHLWRVTSSKAIVNDYLLFFCFLFFVWIVTGYFLKKYSVSKNGKKWNAFLVLLATVVVNLFVANWLMEAGIVVLSVYVVNFQIISVLVSNFIYLFLFYAHRYATNAEAKIVEYDERLPQNIVPAYKLPVDFVENIEKRIVKKANVEVLNFFKQRVDFSNSNVKVLNTSELFNIASLQNYRYCTIINLKLLNNIREINKMFCTINEKLSINGLVFCTFISQNYQKERFLKTYPIVLNHILYLGYFFHRRVLPKLLLTNRLYFDITKAKNRVLSQTEVFGRLYYCGYEIVDYKIIGTACVVCARRIKQPEVQDHRVYGPLIKLYRIGKDGRVFRVYKVRTMHPYSEFLQTYVYEKNDLQEGGKIKDDMRVTAWGKVFRKYWLDELPMFLNVLKGDMKLVGVRPLSNHYFSLYSKELQEKRTKFKPGLLPPFYADMPKTLDEIQASEMKYLTACEEKGVFITDVKYFGKILNSILFKKARSN